MEKHSYYNKNLKTFARKNRNRVVEETIYDAVSNPKRTERLINEAEMNLSFGTANEIKANFKVALDAKTELDALKINPKEQKRFIFEALKEKAAKDAMEASTDPVIKKKNSEIVKEAQEIKEKILNGEDADTIVTEKDKKHQDSRYKQWRKEVRNRDNWQCRLDSEECSDVLETHHILTWNEHKELRYEVNNGITLCRFHHPRKRNDEKSLAPFFQSLVLDKVT